MLISLVSSQECLACFFGVAPFARRVCEKHTWCTLTFSAAVFTSAWVVTTTCLKTNFFHKQTYITHKANRSTIKWQTTNSIRKHQILMSKWVLFHQQTSISYFLFFPQTVVFEPYRAFDHLWQPLTKGNVPTLAFAKRWWLKKTLQKVIFAKRLHPHHIWENV